MRPHGHGRVCVWSGGILWIGISLRAGHVHSHHAVQLAFGLDGPLLFRQSESDEWTPYAGCLIPANLPHAFDGDGKIFVIIFVEPESPEGRRLSLRAAPASISTLEPDEIAVAVRTMAPVWEQAKECPHLEPAAREVIRTIAGTAELRGSTDPRVLGAMELIRVRLDSRVTLTGIARELNISPSRLRHLFVEEVGLPFRTFVLWQRLRRIIQGLGAENLTQAALAAGFADAAHMTRTFRRMIGMAPSALKQVEPASRARDTS